MLCENCNKNPATQFVRISINNQNREVYLCEKCWSDRANDLKSPLPLNTLWESLLEKGPPLRVEAVETCAKCGLSHAEFKETGRLGCPACYQTFRPQILPLLENLQYRPKHSGKTPSRQPGRTAEADRLRELRESLQRAVNNEQYEEAAGFRDEIRRLETDAGGAGT